MLVVASALTDRLSRWKAGLYPIDAVLEVHEPAQLKPCLTSYKPRLLFLDLELSGLGSPAAIRKLRDASPATKIVAVGEPPSDDLELALFNAGARGCCRADLEPATFHRIATAVLRGEPWIRRSLVPRLLDQWAAHNALDATPALHGDKRFADLTQREQQIAALVRKGESNKRIARELDITERTVKAHLTEIFRKLGVDDRLKLALLMTAVPEAVREPAE